MKSDLGYMVFNIMQYFYNMVLTTLHTTLNKKGRKCALAHTARTVRGDIDQRKVES